MSLAGDGMEGLLIHSICVQCRPASPYKRYARMNGHAQALYTCDEVCTYVENAASTTCVQETRSPRGPGSHGGGNGCQAAGDFCFRIFYKKPAPSRFRQSPQSPADLRQ